MKKFKILIFDSNVYKDFDSVYLFEGCYCIKTSRNVENKLCHITVLVFGLLISCWLDKFYNGFYFKMFLFSVWDNSSVYPQSTHTNLGIT